MRIRFLHPARIELKSALGFYRHIDPSLGSRFDRAVRDCLKQLVQFPQAGELVEHPVRRALIAHFPYSIYYMVDSDLVIVAAVHQRQEPINISGRLPNPEL